MINTRAAHIAILQAYSIEMQCAQFSGIGSKPMVSSTHKLAARYEAGKIIAAVEAQAPDIKAWLMWCYGPPVFASLRSNQEHAVKTVSNKIGVSIEPTENGKKIRDQLMLYAAMNNYKSYSVTGRYALLKPKHYDEFIRNLSSGAVGLDVTNRSNFWRDYKNIIDGVATVCARFDEQGLPPVGRALKNVWKNRGEVYA